jgi:O-antigen/teichoic acid export membrane protein
MMAANVLSGVFMAASQFMLPYLTPKSDFSVALTILRIFILVSLPAAAIQVVLAQQTAAAVTDGARRDVSATARGVLKVVFVFWLVLSVIAAAFQLKIVNLLQASDGRIVWAMMMLILGSLLFPVFLGLLQGSQRFLPYGWAMIVNGVGRFAAILVGVKFLQIGATGATLAAFAGFAIACAIGAWPARSVLEAKPRNFDRKAFLKKVALLTAGAGSTIFLINVDMILVQANFPKDVSKFYGGAETIGIAVVLLCVPVAAVMFPKIVRSRATATGSDALRLAVIGTAVIAGATAIFCTFFPEVPLRILYHKSPEMVQAAPLIRWFMWAMVPVTIYNVLINNLIARERYGIVPWAAVLSIGYAVTLHFFLTATRQPPFVTFQRVIQILIFFSTTLMLISVYFSRRASLEEASSAGGGEGRSQPKGARP